MVNKVADTELLIKKANSSYNRVFKRVFDFVFGTLLFIILLPFFFLLTITQLITSGFPIFYRPYRGGYKGEPFKIMKFRTMVKNADQIGGGTTALNDKRITKFGGFLRKSKLDETPQLINIILGNMSFVGPRPELIKYVSQYNQVEQYILEVRPGITDFSSIELINLDELVGETNADDTYEKNILHHKNQLRLRYVSEISLMTDIKIFFVTIIKVVKKMLGIFRRT